jgi:hypothetical protein
LTLELESLRFAAQAPTKWCGSNSLRRRLISVVSVFFQLRLAIFGWNEWKLLNEKLKKFIRLLHKVNLRKKCINCIGPGVKVFAFVFSRTFSCIHFSFSQNIYDEIRNFRENFEIIRPKSTITNKKFSFLQFTGTNMQNIAFLMPKQFLKIAL